MRWMSKECWWCVNCLGIEAWIAVTVGVVLLLTSSGSCGKASAGNGIRHFRPDRAAFAAGRDDSALQQANEKILAQFGADAVLPCRFRDASFGKEERVSWMKTGQYDLLTLGNKTYTDDPRFKPVLLHENREWALRIQPVEINDTGTYQCQVPTDPPTYSFVDLKVIRAVSEISGKEIHVNSGSVLNLRCIVRNLIRKPSFIFWYHTPKGDATGAQPQPVLMNYMTRVKMSIVDGEMDPMNQNGTSNGPSSTGTNTSTNTNSNGINHQSMNNNNNNRDANKNSLSEGVARVDFKASRARKHKEYVGEVVTGLLTIRGVTPSDSGIFTCAPEHATSAMIAVHVLSEGVHEAAIQQGSASSSPPPTLPLFLAAFSLLFLVKAASQTAVKPQAGVSTQIYVQR